MATQLEQKPASKHEAFVGSQLALGQSRVRLLDLVSSGFGLAALTLAFLCLMACLDRAFEFSASTRQLALLLFLGGAGTFAWFGIIRPLRSEVNRHYVARLLEREVPGNRNHVVNWVDLEDEQVPTAFRASLNARAARGLANADLERAVSGRLAWASAGLFAGMLAVFILLLVLFGARAFGALLARAVAPFAFGGKVPTRTQVEVVKPEAGNATVTIGTAVPIVVAVSGRVPSPGDRDAPHLLYRHEDNEPHRRRALSLDELTGRWHTTVSAADVGNGFSYYVTAGDARTEEYEIKAQAAPLVSGFLARYRYRPYVGKADRTATSRKIEGLRGTEVAVTLRTNRPVHRASLGLELDDGRRVTVPATLLPDHQSPATGHRNAAQFRFTLESSGRYRVRYWTPEGEEYRDATESQLEATADEPPAVNLTAPGEDTTAPLNGTVELRGVAKDDIGVAALALHLKPEGGAELPPRPYLADKLGKPGFGTPRQINYLEALPLAPLVKQASLKPGDVLECWLEARDACDFHKPNSAASKKLRITLAASADAGLARKQQEEARKREEEHRKEQEEMLQKEQAARDEEKKKEEKQEEEAARAREKKPGKGDGKEEKKDDSDKGDKGGKGGKDGETEKTAEKLQDAIDKNKGGKDGKGEKDGPQDDKGEGKGEGKAQGDKGGKNKPGKPDDNPGEGKDQGDMSKAGKPGEQKDEKDAKPQGARGEGKPTSNDKKDAQGEAKPGASGPEKKGECKGGCEKAAPSGKGKGEGKPQGEGQPGEGKNQGMGGGQPGGAKGPGGNKGGGKGGPKGEGKGGKGEGGEGKGSGGGGAGGSEGAAKAGGGKDAGPATGKPEGPMGDGTTPGAGKGEQEGKAEAGGIGMKKGERGMGTGGGGQDTATPPGKKQKPTTSRAMMLQLQEFNKSIDANVLRDAKMSREQLRKFLRDYEALARRREKLEKEDAVRGGAATLPSTGGEATPAPADAKADDLRGTGRPQPPFEIRGRYDAFMKRLSRKK